MILKDNCAICERDQCSEMEGDNRVVFRENGIKCRNDVERCFGNGNFNGQDPFQSECSNDLSVQVSNLVARASASYQSSIPQVYRRL